MAVTYVKPKVGMVQYSSILATLLCGHYTKHQQPSQVHQQKLTHQISYKGRYFCQTSVQMNNIKLVTLVTISLQETVTIFSYDLACKREVTKNNQYFG